MEGSSSLVEKNGGGHRPPWAFECARQAFVDCARGSSGEVEGWSHKPFLFKLPLASAECVRFGLVLFLFRAKRRRQMPRRGRRWKFRTGGDQGTSPKVGKVASEKPAPAVRETGVHGMWSTNSTTDAVRCVPMQPEPQHKRKQWSRGRGAPCRIEGGSEVRTARVAEQESLTEAKARLERLRSEAASVQTVKIPDHRWRHSNKWSICCLISSGAG